MGQNIQLINFTPIFTYQLKRNKMTTKTINKKTIISSDKNIKVFVNGKEVTVASVIALPKLINVKIWSARINGMPFECYTVIGKY